MGIGIIIGMVIGLVVGFVLSALFDKLKGGDDTVKVKQMEAEHNEYRKQVDDHFVNTAVLFKGLTDQYRDVYQHIAQGAGELCSDEAKELKMDLAETALLAQASAVETVETVETVDEGNDVSESLNKSETVQEENADEDDIPLASEVEMSSDIAEELKNQVAKKPD